MSTTIIAGAGHAGGQTAISLRQAGYEGRIVVCGAEPVPPYQRPPLSKKYLSGELALERVFLRPESFYSRNDIEFRLGNAVRKIDPGLRSVELEDGESLAFTDLVIATGSRPRRLDAPGSDLGNIFYLRSLEDSDAIRNALEAGRRLVVVGGGYIGLEIASTAKGLGLEVCVIEAADRILGRVTAPEMSDYYTRAHRSRGVDVRLSAAVTAFEGADTVEGVDCGGETIPADVVVIGIGIVPEAEMAASAGIRCDDGILVDERCATSADHVHAVGDCTRHPNPIPRPYPATGVRAQCAGAGEDGRLQHRGSSLEVRAGSLVLERSVRPQAPDGRDVAGVRHHCPARLDGRGRLRDVLLEGRGADRGGRGQSPARVHGLPQARAATPDHRPAKLSDESIPMQEMV